MGWVTGREGGKVMRQLRDAKDQAAGGDHGRGSLEAIRQALCWVLARAHAKAGTRN